MKSNKILILSLSLFLLAAGCSSNNEGTNLTDTTNDPANAGGPADTEQPADSNTNDSAAGNDETTMELFEQMTAGGANSAELLTFITEYHTQLQPDNVTAMLVSLEKAQLEQSPELEERYYSEAGIQEKLIELYSKDFQLPTADEVEDEALNKLMKETEARGYKLETAEGSFFPVIDYERYRQFQPSATEDMRAYIEIMALESNVAALKDAGLVIEWSEVIARSLSMENFLRDYPNSVKREDMQQLFDGYSYVTFMGVDNSPLFNYEDDTLLPEVKEAFTQAVSGGTENSEYLETMKQFLELVEKNGGKQTEEVSSFQDQVTVDLY